MVQPLLKNPLMMAARKSEAISLLSVLFLANEPKRLWLLNRLVVETLAGPKVKLSQKIPKTFICSKNTCAIA